MTDMQLLLAQLESIREEQLDQKLAIRSLVESLIGSTEKAGLAERVRSLEAQEGRRKWALRTAVGAAIAAVVHGVFK